MDTETTVLNIIDNGVLIIDRHLTILFWNNWLAINTGISQESAQGKRVDELFPDTSFKILKRKVKVSLKLQSSTFTNSQIDKYIIPIPLNKITNSRFRYMHQDVVITPLGSDEISVIIYDTTALLEAKATINEQLDIVKKQASTDPLLGCYNRKMFNDLLATEVMRANRHNHPFSLIMIDIDNFKSVNDTYGHLVGDEVLKGLSSLTAKSIRESDLFARWGGEEFIILLPETYLTGAAVVAEKIRLNIANYDNGTAGKRTCSFGVSEFSIGTNPEILINNADKALYAAKGNGKNQVMLYRDEQNIPWPTANEPITEKAPENASKRCCLTAE
ncbi:GGDEF domain-containing protein [Desulfotalea psychrophila]|uniref:diguanylate cyclase n=1 Tax=Desulfotalea psychrophila (strain LSv54 / DSM 12343) TaxID=177439 RepID=Q6AMZ3_DESPS|nr:GGDEF domain-containing protein [Desulfotalea psychrophila]CAG36281.1 conserved hypothetical protein [Desulfotalea psychrophila LSv54]